MYNYNRITRSLQRTAEQLSDLRRYNDAKAIRRANRISFYHRIHDKLTALRDRLSIALRNEITSLDHETARAQKTAERLLELLGA